MVNKHHNITAWLAEHPNAHRALYFVGTTYALCLWAVVAAPTASAAVGSAALGWTGLHDTDGVPLAAYFLSTVDAQEYALNNGQHVSAIDPTTWVSWTAKAIQGAVWHSTVAWWLTNEAALMLALLGFALWLLRFSMSSAWLVALAQVGRPVYAAVRTLAYNMMLGPIAITICLICAGWQLMTASFHPLRWGNLWIVLGIGFCGTAAQLAMTRAYRTGNTLVVGALSYSTLVFGAAATYVVWNDRLPPAELAGIAVIVASGLMAMRVEKKEAIEEAGFEG